MVSPTGFALSVALAVNEEVFPRQGVSLGAMRLYRPKRDGPTHVLLASYRLEMRRVTAARIATKMVDVQTIRNVAHKLLVGEAVGVNEVPVAEPKRPITPIVVRSVPFPACVWVVGWDGEIKKSFK
jgi:hypothetical protein